MLKSSASMPLRPELKSFLIDDLTNSSGFITEYKDFTPEEIEAGLTKAGYPPEQVKEISNTFEAKRQAGTLGKPTAAPVTTDPNVKPSATTLGNAHATITTPDGAIIELVGGEISVSEDGVTTVRDKVNLDNPPTTGEYKNVKRRSWKKIVGWTLASVGGGGGVIIGILKLLGVGFLGYKTIGIFENALKANPSNHLNPLPKCLTDMLEYQGTSIATDINGDPIIVVVKTGNAEYDKMGGLKFYKNGTVATGNGQKIGKWQSKVAEPTPQAGGEGEPPAGDWQSRKDVADQFEKESLRHYNGLNVREEKPSLSVIYEELLIERELQRGDYTDYFGKIRDQLKGNMNAGNLDEVLKLLNKLKGRTLGGKDVISSMMWDYERNYKRNLIADTQNMQGLDAAQQATQADILAILQSKAAGMEKLKASGQIPGQNTGQSLNTGQADNQGGEVLTNINNLVGITWNDGWTAGGGSGTGRRRSSIYSVS